MTTNPANEPTTVALDDGRHLTIPEGDYPEVAQEVFGFVIDRLHKFSDELSEFLAERDGAARTSVSIVRFLDVVINYYAQRSLRAWVK